LVQEAQRVPLNADQQTAPKAIAPTKPAAAPVIVIRPAPISDLEPRRLFEPGDSARPLAVVVEALPAASSPQKAVELQSRTAFQATRGARLKRNWKRGLPRRSKQDALATRMLAALEARQAPDLIPTEGIHPAPIIVGATPIADKETHPRTQSAAELPPPGQEPPSSTPHTAVVQLAPTTNGPAPTVKQETKPLPVAIPDLVIMMAERDPATGQKPQAPIRLSDPSQVLGSQKMRRLPDPVVQFAAESSLQELLQESSPEERLPANDGEAGGAEEIAAVDDGLKPISEVATRISVQAGELPTNYAAARFSREGEVEHRMGTSRDHAESLMMWEAPGVCHRPLYFEEVNLERHGYKVPILQPALSMAHFFGRIPALPYMIASERHHRCTYTLGHYRPGDYAPYSLYLPRFSVGGSALETVAVAGILFAFP
jgi:hypothetical protein